MQKAGPSSAKLARPRLHHAVARDRLYRKLDEACEHRSAVCVVGPPGAGKTTLVASWADTRGRTGIWYQVDAGDADLATFFSYLGEAARTYVRKGRRPLPALTPEYLQDIAGFSRRFFRDLFAALPPGACVVLDNYQEVPAEEPYHQLVAEAIAEISPAHSLIVISRRDPPRCYARLLANENVAFVDWADLRLTLDETRAIILGRAASLSAVEVERLHAESGGWAAGVTLLLEGRRRSLTRAPDAFAEREVLFDYFAGQIFAQVSEDTRRFLAMTALLPQVPVSIARELTGNSAAAEILESLYQRHLFTHRRAGTEPTYWFHALFRDFLLARVDRTLTAAEREQYERRAGRLLEAHGSIDDAFILFWQSRDWEAVARLAARHASELLARGRGHTLREWILALPAQCLEGDPWLRYWLGTSLISIDQQQARDQLENGYASFVLAGNRAGMALAAAGVLDTYYFEWSDFRHMASWVEKLEPLLAQNLFLDTPSRELKLYASMLIGILYGAPGHKQLRRCVERVSEMLDENLDVNSKLTAATYLLSYCNLAGELELGRSVLQRASPLLGSEQLTPLNELWWHLRLAHFHTMVGDLSAADAALAHVRHVAATHGLNGLRSAALLTRSYEQVVACMQGDRARVQRLAGELEALARPNRPQDMFHVVDGKMYGATLNADARALCSGGPVSYNAGLAAGMVYIQVLSLVRWAHGAALAGDRDTLEECVRRTRCLIAGTYLTYFECEIRLLQAYAALAHRHALDAPACIRQALVYAREHRFHYPNNVRFSATLLHVLDAALREGVEVNYAREIIARYRLRPINGLNVEWPWPIRLFTLGRFEVQIEGSPLRFPGKTPRKPLALLKAIVAHGGHEVPQARLIDALWPNEDGDAGKHALGVTIVRLRKLLGSHDALTVADERVSLNDSVCWVDALAFEAKLRHSGDAMDAASEAAIIRIQEALAMYKGAFLPSDTDEPWSVQFRLRLRGLFTASVEDLGAQHEARREWDRAIAWYRRGLEADDLIEEFYLGQMRCFLALQRPAEGLAVFRRLRQTLAVVLGLAPSPASEAMARTLSQSNQSVSG